MQLCMTSYACFVSGPQSVLCPVAQPARAELASGIPGSQNFHAWRYCLLLFFVGSLTSWSAVNNAAILSEVG